MKTHTLLLFATVNVLHLSLATVANEPPTTALAFAPEAGHLVAVSQSGIHVLSWPELNHQRTLQASTPNLHCLAFSPDHRHVAVGGGAPSEDGVIDVFSWPNGDPVTRFEGHADAVRTVIWRDEVTLLSGSIDHEIKRWSLKDAPSALSTLRGHSRSINAMCLIENGRTLVSTGADQSLRIWEVTSGSLLRTLNQHTKPVTALSPQPIRAGLPMVASAARDRTIRFWQPTIGRMVRYIRLESEPLNLVWTSDGERILAACVDGHLRVIDPVEVTVTEDLPAIDGWAYALAVHPEDHSAAIGGANGQIRRIEIPFRSGTDNGGK